MGDKIKLITGTESRNCGNCMFGYTDGMYAPAMWCKLHKHAIAYMYIDSQCTGTVCENFKRSLGADILVANRAVIEATSGKLLSLREMSGNWYTVEEIINSDLKVYCQIENINELILTLPINVAKKLKKKIVCHNATGEIVSKY